MGRKGSFDREEALHRHLRRRKLQARFEWPEGGHQGRPYGPGA